MLILAWCPSSALQVGSVWAGFMKAWMDEPWLREPRSKPIKKLAILHHFCPNLFKFSKTYFPEIITYGLPQCGRRAVQCSVLRLWGRFLPSSFMQNAMGHSAFTRSFYFGALFKHFCITDSFLWWHPFCYASIFDQSSEKEKVGN